MGFLQGSPLPDVKETTTATTTPSTEGYGTFLENIVGAGSGALTTVGPDGKPIAKTGTELVAGYDPMQTLGYGAIPGAAAAYKPGLEAAQSTAAQAAAGITPERIQALMNPFTSNVVNEMARLSQQNVERNLMPTMKAGFVGTGGLGSQRYAGALGQSMADVQSGLTGQQYGALSKGYSEALKGSLDEAQLQNLAAKTQGDLAKAQQELGLTGAGALTKAGAEQQAYQQSILDAPLKTAKSAADLLRGYTMPGEETKTFAGPRTKDYYQASDAQRLGGLTTFLGSAASGKGLDVLKKAGTNLLDYLTGKQDTIDMGGGLTMSFDRVTGAPIVKGGADFDRSNEANTQDYRDAGFTMDETGTFYMPEYDYTDYGN